MVASPSRSAFGVVSQIALAASCLATAAFWPPANGSLLALSLGGGSAVTINIALTHGARVEGAGPIPGWVVLRGERDRLAGPLWAHGIVLVAGASWMCGS